MKQEAYVIMRDDGEFLWISKFPDDEQTQIDFSTSLLWSEKFEEERYAIECIKIFDLQNCRPVKVTITTEEESDIGD